jgi:phage host-nuclease inhibitor protein Gam
VDNKLLVKAVPNDVEKEEKLWFKKLVVEMNEEVKEAEEIYPIDPRPFTEEIRVVFKKVVETKLIKFAEEINPAV